VGTKQVEPEPLLTTEDLAGELKMPVETVETWRWRRKGPAFLRIGRHVRYSRSDVDAWIARQRVEQGAR